MVLTVVLRVDVSAAETVVAGAVTMAVAPTDLTVAATAGELTVRKEAREGRQRGTPPNLTSTSCCGRDATARSTKGRRRVEARCTRSGRRSSLQSRD